MLNVFLLLGSNLGDRLWFLKRATIDIESQIGHLLRASSVYETRAWGKTDVPDYLNQVLEIETNLGAICILDEILKIETELGRKRVEKWGSRNIDIDILFFGSEIINEPQLQIPHPELHKRRFTLEPIAEIAPNFIHPIFNKSIKDLKEELNDVLNVKIYNFNVL